MKTFSKILSIFLVFTQVAQGGLPPTTMKASGDANPVTTFNFEFPNFTVTHTGVKSTMGVNAVAGGGTGVTSVTTAPAASSFAGWDANKNLSANNHLAGYTTTATAAGTTTLTVGSTYQQIFTGTTTQTVVLPVASTLVLGQQFSVTNLSTGVVTVQSSGANTIQAMAANTQLNLVCILTSGTGTASWTQVYSAINGIALGAPAPTVQKFTSGTGTYTTPANVAFINVMMVGAGAGGSGSGDSGSGGAGGTGGTSTFGTTLLSAVGGSPGTGGNSAGGVGGTASLGSGPIGTAISGGTGTASQRSNSASVFGTGGAGGNNALGGAGGGGRNNVAGNAGATNTGGGGGGGGTTASSTSSDNGAGGGAGGYINAIITSPLATYSYAVGAAGTAGSAGTNGFVGGAGGSGYIVVTEYYYNGLGAFAGLGGAYTPTVQKFTSSSGTYTTPANTSYLQVCAVGAGGGGAGSGTASAGSGGAGGNTTFGSSLLTANGGGGGSNTGTPGTGGTATVAAPAIQQYAFTGSTGNGASGINGSGGMGGSTPLGGAGGGGPTGANAGTAGVTNTGSGGGGGGIGATGGAGSGGGAAGYLCANILSPSATYSYAVGAAGTTGSAGTSGGAGGAGGSGYIVVTEYYNNGAVGTATNVTGIVAVANGGTGSSTGPQSVTVQDVKSANTSGGTATSGSWQTRTLNTLNNPNSFSWVSIASNQITLTSGTYLVTAEAPAFTVSRHKAKLRNISDSTDTILGSSEFATASTSGQTSSFIKGQFTIASTKTFEIQHQVQNTVTTNGFGVESNFSVSEIYTQVLIQKIN